MAENRTKVAKFLEELAAAQGASGEGASIEFVLRQMDANRAALLRRAAIPHQFNEALLNLLNTGTDVADALARFKRLSMISTLPDGEFKFHDRARRYLFNWWLDPERHLEFTKINEIISDYFSLRQKRSEPPSPLDHLHHLFHRMGANVGGPTWKLAPPRWRWRCRMLAAASA